MGKNYLDPISVSQAEAKVGALGGLNSGLKYQHEVCVSR